MRIAIVGSGISGLVCAHLLHPDHEITLFEAGDHVGGHTHTVRVQDQEGDWDVDTGFVVFNRTTYPSFLRLLQRLDVPYRPTDMSFSVKCGRSGLEYCGTSLNTLFAQRSNILRPSFHRMLGEILRFNREARDFLAEEHPDPDPSLDDFLRRHRHSAIFREQYIVPMAAAIWSAEPGSTLHMPALFFLRFFRNHGLLAVHEQLPWLVVEGGSGRYVERLTAPFTDRIRLRTPVRAIRRRQEAAGLRTDDGGWEWFDHVILATHSDQARRLLIDPSPREDEILSAMPYQPNRAVLHRDVTPLPRRRRAWASWNVHLPEQPEPGVQVTYNMSRLQSLPSREPFCVSLNMDSQVAPERVLRRLEFSHPVFDGRAVAAQKRHDEISGRERTHFCGAYWGNGFHEDGVRSALAVTGRLGAPAL